MNDVQLLSSYDFSRNTSFRANTHLRNTRSDNHRLTPEPPQVDIWKRKPPDFRPQVYAAKPPKRNSRASMQPWRYDNPGEKKQLKETMAKRNKHKLPTLSTQSSTNKDKLFRTCFKDLGIFEASLAKVADSIKEMIPFENPIQYDYRALQPIAKLGLPEFDTTNDKDPFDLKFKRERLHIIKGLDTIPLRELTGLQIGHQALKQPEKWQKELHLDKETYPDRRKEFSRFRENNRCTKDTLLTRIENVLKDKWCVEGGTTNVVWKD